MDFTQARVNMVKSQLAPNRVEDPQLLDTLLEVPREAFVDSSQQAFAYSDHAVSMDGGERRYLKPLQMSLMIQALKIKAGERALVLGAGTGYEAAVLSQLGAEVLAVESDAALVARGEKLPAAAKVRWRTGEPAKGWAEEGPCHAILFCGSVQSVPGRIIDQLHPEGRLVAVVGQPGDVVMSAVRILGSGSHKPETLFETVAPPLVGDEGAGQRFVL